MSWLLLRHDEKKRRKKGNDHKVGEVDQKRDGHPQKATSKKGGRCPRKKIHKILGK